MAEYISRESAIVRACKVIQNDFIAFAVKDAIKAIPAADVVPVRHGRWIVDDITGLVKCSECDNDAPLDTTGGGQWRSPFCHLCGAIMDGDGE